MRSYPHNSPEAAARIVALVVISDGNVCKAEMDAGTHLEIERELGLSPGRFGQLVRELCENQMMHVYGTSWNGGGVDEETLASVMAEVTLPELRRKCLHLASTIAQADRHLSEAEMQILSAAQRYWGITAGEG